LSDVAYRHLETYINRHRERQTDRRTERRVEKVAVSEKSGSRAAAAAG